MLNVQIICTGNIKEKYLRDAIDEYSKRLSAYCRLSIKEYKDGQSILPLPQKAYKIALCVEGKQYSSEELASAIDSLAVRGVSDIAIVIGGFSGLSEEEKAACDLRLSFSRMTFPHQLMRVILLEQFYRAFNINAGGKYHK